MKSENEQKMRQEFSRVSDGNRDGSGSKRKKVSNSDAEFLDCG
jgi:hypothetical protein